MAVIPPFFTDCVVAIGHEGNAGAVRWAASGFLYGKLKKANKDRAKSEYAIYLVTNKHVLADNSKIFIRVNPKAAAPARQFDAALMHPASGKQLWIGHEVKEVDVAVLPINYQLLLGEEMAVSFFASDQHSLNAQGMDDAGLSEGAAIFAMGFPMGLVGDERNTVIVRSGVLARVRDTLVKPRFPFMVDATVFPGNSGGPIVSKPEVISISGTKSYSSAALIGVVASYAPYIDVAVSQQTGRPRVTFEENSGLTNVYSVDCINETISAAEAAAGGGAQEEAQPVETEASDSSE